MMSVHNNRVESISTDELMGKIGDSNSRIIDIRSVNAYNGWRERGETRGGHIKGAKSLPAKWVSYFDWEEIVRSKKILPEQAVILYGYENDPTEEVANKFLKAGYKNVKIYDEFISEWCKDKKYPLEYLSRYNRLVSAKWLNELMNKGTAPEYDNNKFVVCHSHYRNRDDYEFGHIPGAVELDTNSLESTETWNRRTPEELREVLQNHGITHDTTVILYGRFSYPESKDPYPGSSAGHLGAFRCAFIMMYAGVKDVRMLNGGILSWIDEGFDVTTEETPIHPAADFGIEIPAKPGIAADLPAAQVILQSSDKNLVSVRSWDEYIGEVSGYNYIEKKGRIPGSVFALCGSDPYHMENYRNLDHTTKEYHEIEQDWAKAGITPDKHNSFYCGTGWRGSEAFYNAWLMGWNNISLYDGGWFEWSNNDMPYETGVPR